MLLGNSCVKNCTVRSSTGSTQNAVLAAPPQRELADAAGHAGLHRVDGHADAEAEADPVERRLAEQRTTERGEVDAARQVVAGHVPHRAGGQDANAVELAAT